MDFHSNFKILFCLKNGGWGWSLALYRLYCHMRNSGKKTIVAAHPILFEDNEILKYECKSIKDNSLYFFKYSVNHFFKIIFRIRSIWFVNIRRYRSRRWIRLGKRRRYEWFYTRSNLTVTVWQATHADSFTTYATYQFCTCTRPCPWSSV